MLKNDTLKNGTSRIGLYGSAPPGMTTSPTQFDLKFSKDGHTYDLP